MEIPKMHPLPGGTFTNFPPGSVGYRREKEFAEYIFANKDLGFGNMIRMIEQIWQESEKAGNLDK